MFSGATKKISSAIAFVIFLIFTLWWLYLRVYEISSDHTLFQLFGALYGLIALYGAIWGFYASKKWGGIKSAFGKSIFFFSLGLLFQEVGQLAYSFYVEVLHVEVPYPSFGDLFFYGTVPFYILGAVYLAKVSGVHISLRYFKGTAQSIIIPIILLILSYMFFLQGYVFDWSQPLIVIIDFFVPLGQAVYIAIAILTYTLSRGVLGGVMKSRVLLILFALLMQYIADWTFLFLASRDMWAPGGINDYMYLSAYFLMTISLLQLKVVYSRLNDEKS